RSRERASGAGERRALARARHLPLIGGAGDPPRFHDRPRLHALRVRGGARRLARLPEDDAPQPGRVGWPRVLAGRAPRARRSGVVARRRLRGRPEGGCIGMGSRRELPRATGAGRDGRRRAERRRAGGALRPSGLRERARRCLPPAREAGGLSDVSVSGQLSAQGKVRDLYDAGDALMMSASDRISAFDVVLPTLIPDKGRVLTGLSLFWFDRLSDVIDNHLITADAREFPPPFDADPELRGRAMLVKRADVVK